MWLAEADQPYAYGAIATCPERAVLVSGSKANPARVKITPLGGANAGSQSTYVVAGGELYSDEAAAQAANAVLGSVGDITVGSDITGDGWPTALIPSTDGFLYGLQPCSETLRFAVDLGAPVGEAVLGDTDDDGRDEIIVSVADGYLYGLL